jgi:hypothetical protein
MTRVPRRCVIAPTGWWTKLKFMVTASHVSFKVSFQPASDKKPLLRRLALRNGFGDQLDGMAAEILRRYKHGWPLERPLPTREISNAYA